MTRSQWLIGLTVVMCLATFFRTYQLTRTPPGLFFDEAANGTDALDAIHTGHWSVFYPQNGGREGLFINLQSLMLRATGVREPWVLRSVSAIFGILTVLGVAFLGSRLAGKEVGLVAAFLMAVGFWHVNFSRIGLRAISAPFFLTWAMVILIAARKNRRLSLCFAAGIFYGLGFHTYIAYRVTPLIFGFAVISVLRNVRAAVAVVIGAIVAALPLILYFRARPADFVGRVSEVVPTSAAQITRHAFLTFTMLIAHGDQNWRHNVSGSPQLWLPVGLLFIAGLIWCLTGRARSGGLLVVWLVASALPAALSNEGVPHALRSILMIPAVCLIAAIGFAEIYRLRPNKALAAIVLAAIATQGYVEYFVVWRDDARVAEAFGTKYLNQAYAIRQALKKDSSAPTYFVGRDLKISDPFYLAQPVMFLTDTGDGGNVHYIPEGGESRVPPGSRIFRISP